VLLLDMFDARGRLATISILIADDSEAFRDASKLYLTNIRAAWKFAAKQTTGEEAVRQVATCPRCYSGSILPIHTPGHRVAPDP